MDAWALEEISSDYRVCKPSIGKVYTVTSLCQPQEIYFSCGINFNLGKGLQYLSHLLYHTEKECGLESNPVSEILKQVNQGQALLHGDHQVAGRSLAERGILDIHRPYRGIPPLFQVTAAS